jgi:hypothetical protein
MCFYQNNLKMQAVRYQQEIEGVQRRIGDVNMRLTAEMKVAIRCFTIVAAAA